jgi:plastocyanin
MRKSTLALLLALAALALAAGCGGDDDEETTAATTETTTTEAGGGGGGGGGETVSMTEYEFDSNDLSVSQGDTLTVTNDGSIEHNLTIEEASDAKKSSTELAATPNVAPGDSADLTVNVDPGQHSIVCTIDDHRGLGMIGTIDVK